MNILFSDLLKLFVIILVPQFVAGFALVQQQHVTLWTRHPFDSFKARRKIRGDVHVVVSDAHRFGSSLMISKSNQFNYNPFSSGIAATKPGSPGEARNRTLSDKNNNKSLQEIHQNSNNTNVTNHNSTNNNNRTTTTTTVLSSSSSSSSFTRLSIDSKNKTSRSTGLGSYFHFLDQSQSKAQKGPQTVASVKTGNTNKNNKNRNKSYDNSAKALLNKQSNETITVADLQVVLAQMQMQSANPYKPPNRMKTYSSNEGSESNGYGGSKTKSSKHVAFPQPSAMRPREIRRGTAVASCLLGMILGTTILPNLWLLGMVAGVLYGFEITKDISEEHRPQLEQADKIIVANFLISCGKQLARAYINIVDGGKALWFLYKTGQLSYEYYKTYETMDKKFAIQNKVDAWNKVFVKGKRKFDAWEQENEVGRKMLAGIRTAWLVDEKSRMRAAGRSRYRLVQSAYDLRRSTKKLLQKGLRSIRSIFRERELQTFLKGLRTSWQTDGSPTTRIGAIVAAVVAVNICGSLFSISAVFSNLLAIAAAVIWPSWAPDLFSRTQEIWLETKSRGTKEDYYSSNKKFSLLTPFECIQKKYEEYASDKISQSRRNKQQQNKNYSKRKSLSSKRPPKRKQPKPKRQQKSSSWFGFSDRRK
jgi:hypothetical protein